MGLTFAFESGIISPLFLIIRVKISFKWSKDLATESKCNCTWRASIQIRVTMGNRSHFVHVSQLRVYLQSEISGKLPRKEKEKFDDGDLIFYEVNPEERQCRNGYGHSGFFFSKQVKKRRIKLWSFGSWVSLMTTTPPGNWLQETIMLFIVHSTKLLNFDWSRPVQLIPNCTP